MASKDYSKLSDDALNLLIEQKRTISRNESEKAHIHFENSKRAMSEVLDMRDEVTRRLSDELKRKGRK